jgi:chemotaxis protein MotB
LISCVSTKEFEALSAEKRKLEMEKQDMQSIIESNNEMIRDLQQKEVQLANAQTQLSESNEKVMSLQQSQKDLLKKYDELLAQSQQVLNNASEEKALLSDQLEAKQNELDVKARELGLLEMKLKSQEENLFSLQEDVRIRERKLLELTERLHAQDSMMHALRSSVNDALTGFSASDLTITERDGKVYVSLSQNLLFAKGSNVIDSGGKNAIRKLAQVLKNHPDIQINVEGHTDTDGSASKNWDLSVSRATAVVKEMTGSGLDPYQVTASGRAFYDPVAANDTEENKSMNRRTEIILSPRLDELYSLIGY